MNNTRLFQLVTKMENWINASCVSEHPCPLPAFQNLVSHLHNQVENLPESVLTQQRLQEYEKLMAVIKTSPSLKSCQPALNSNKVQKVDQVDPWDWPEEEGDQNEQAKFNETLFKKALAFYGLPETWERIYSLCGDNGTLAKTTGLRAAQDNISVWTQVNIPFKKTAYKTAGVKEIEIVNNISLDFEYAPAPMKVHAIALEFKEWLVGQGYADKDLPVEDSGAGAHIILPISPIVTSTIEGGPERINLAIAKLVKGQFSPVFEQSADRYGLKGKIALDCFNINRIISMPGTWRPKKKDQLNHYSLKDGYQRRWLAPYDIVELTPNRILSISLTRAVLMMCEEIGAEEVKARENVISIETYRKVGDSLKEKQAENYAKAAYQGNLEELRTMQEGGRNNTVNKVAFRIGRLIAAGLPIWESTAFMDIVTAACQAGMTKHEAERTARSGLTSGLGKPANIELKEFEAS